jgi:glycogen debranching enzyme
MRSLRSSCESVIRGNDRGSYTVPSPKLYPHQWAWDSAFAAIGWAHIDPARAWLELKTLLGGQWEDGRIPHIRFHDLSGDYFPSPKYWRTERSTSISQPPIWATAARRVLQIVGDAGPLAALLPSIDASHAWFHAHRDPLGWNAIAVSHPWESGLDNSPAWDAALEAIDPEAAPPFERRDNKIVEDAAQRPTDDQYRRYMALVDAIADDHFGPGPFAVYDPLMTAVLARAEDDLAWLGAELGYPNEARARADRLRSGLDEHLWDEEAGVYRYIDARSGARVMHDLIGGYGPLFAHVLAERRVRLEEGLRTRFWTPYPLPSTAPSDPAFDGRRYWRGPTWVNTNWMLSEAVGSGLMDRTVELVEKSGFREYFHCETGEGLGADDFTWTAALVLDHLA